jgi:REP element-mobilizing transposase RayT
MNDHKHLKRLERIWIQNPIIFITTCTHQRKPILAEPRVATILTDEWSRAENQHGWIVGRYVILPDHVHFFCAPVTSGQVKSLSEFMKHWKQWTSKRIIRECNHTGEEISAPVWQAEFFDHVLRSLESYSQKWFYVRENPVRAGLVENAKDWPWQGEISPL